MQDNSDTSPDNIRALHRRGGNPLLVVQNNQSLGIVANTTSDVQGSDTSGQSISTSGSAGIDSFGADAVISPASSNESYQETYDEQSRFENLELPE